MGIQINGQTDTISAADGGVIVSGYELSGPSNINVTGVVTATTFNGNLTGNVTGNLNSSGVNTATTISGTTATYTTFNGALSGTATTATNLANAENITTGTINFARLSGNYNIDVTGNLNSSGVSTISQLNVGTGGTIITTTAGGLIGIGTTNPQQKLDVYGAISVRLPSLTYVPAVTISTPGGLPGLSIFTNQASSKQYDIACDGDNFVFRREGVELSRIDSSGRVKMPYQPAFLAYSTNGQTTYGNAAEFILNLTQTNVGNHYSTTTGRFTAPVAGFYAFDYGIYAYTAGQMSFKLNGSDYILGDTLGLFSISVNTINGASIMLSLSANDSVSFGWRNASSGDVYRAHGWFSGYLVG